MKVFINKFKWLVYKREIRAKRKTQQSHLRDWLNTEKQENYPKWRAGETVKYRGQQFRTSPHTTRTRRMWQKWKQTMTEDTHYVVLWSERTTCVQCAQSLKGQHEVVWSYHLWVSHYSIVRWCPHFYHACTNHTDVMTSYHTCEHNIHFVFYFLSYLYKIHVDTLICYQMWVRPHWCLQSCPTSASVTKCT